MFVPLLWLSSYWIDNIIIVMCLLTVQRYLLSFEFIDVIAYNALCTLFTQRTERSIKHIANVASHIIMPHDHVR